MFRRKKKSQTPLTDEEKRELALENLAYARKCADEGNVSGMEMGLEAFVSYSHQINQIVDPREINVIKLKGYETGVQNIRNRVRELQESGAIQEAEKLEVLLRSYRREAASIRDELEQRERIRRRRMSEDQEK